MKCSIPRLGISMPQNVNRQADVSDMFAEVVCETDRQRRVSRMLFQQSGVETRYGVVSDDEGPDWKNRQDPLNPGMGPRPVSGCRFTRTTL